MTSIYILLLISTFVITRYSTEFIKSKLVNFCNVIIMGLFSVCYLLYLHKEKSFPWITDVAEVVYAIMIFTNAFYLAYCKIIKQKKAD